MYKKVVCVLTFRPSQKHIGSLYFYYSGSGSFYNDLLFHFEDIVVLCIVFVFSSFYQLAAQCVTPGSRCLPSLCKLGWLCQYMQR